MGVGGDELGLADARGGVDDGVGATEAMVEADVGRRESDRLIERNDFAEERLRGEAIRERATAVLGEVPIDLIDDHGRNQNRGFAFEVMAERGCLRVFGQVFEPACGVNEVDFRTAPCGHDIRLSTADLWRCRGAP